MPSNAPRRPILLLALRTLNVITICVAACVIISIILSFVDNKPDDFVDFMVRLYTMVFALAVIVGEIGHPEAIRTALVFRWWPVRGAVYAFLGFLGLQLSGIKETQAAKVFSDIMGWAMVGIGVLYILMGLVCMDKLQRKQSEQYGEATKAHATAESVRAATAPPIAA